jgi:gamma-glutamylcyclotransferase (GGCT)/AIG2-like uncharacterized protein YtfP
MAERCPHSPLACTGWLMGWRLTFGGEEKSWDGALPTIVEAAGHQVFVAVYEVSEADERGLDAWEGVDLEVYTKVRLRVSTLDGATTAWTYVVNAFEGGLPTARTIGTIADAAEAADAPQDYVHALRALPCRSSGH